MGAMLLEASEVGFTAADVFGGLTKMFTYIVGLFQQVLGIITGNPLLYVPVLLSLLGGVVFFVIGVVRRFGVRGASSSGRKRRRGR